MNRLHPSNRRAESSPKSFSLIGASAETQRLILRNVKHERDIFYWAVTDGVELPL